MVCGQAHPQKTLPKMTVNSMINTKNVSMPNAKMKKSCGPNICPNMMNFLSKIFNMMKGSPFNLIQGSEKKMIK
jgi:hypothetical protein